MLLREIIATGTYAAVIPTESTLALLRAWADSNCIELDSDLHVTTLYSRKIVNVVPCPDEFVASGVGFDKFGDSLVLKLSCPALVARHEQLIGQGGTHDYESFAPHLTIQAKSALNPDGVPPIEFGLIFHREYTEPLDESA
jgi:hypothetical protein